MTSAWNVEIVRPVPRVDERWLLDEDDTPEAPLHDLAIDLLTAVLRAWVRRTGRGASVHRNMALRWVPDRPRVGCDPDVCLVEPALPEEETSLCLWKPGHAPPRVAIEVVSEGTAAKDYNDNPARYAANGTQELWVFDPLRTGPAESGGPWLLQVWSRGPGGRFRQVYAGEGGAFSDVLGAWLVVTDGGRRLRIADDEAGQRLWPTGEEAALAEVARRDEEVDRLRARLAKLGGA
jgi:Uma2 family endonuclease